MMGCDILKVNNINPYTETGTFGISWNGGYKPDPTLEYLPPDDNTVPTVDYDSVGELPLYAIPPNIYLKTAESRRFDIFEGGIPSRVYEYDEPVESHYRPAPSEELVSMESVDMPGSDVTPKDSSKWDKFLVGIIIALLIVFFLSMKKD
jgi:hypothetical protein